MLSNQSAPQLNKGDLESLYNWIAYKVSCPDFRNSIKDFINDNCSIFIDKEENISEYEQIFKQFKKLINDLLKDILYEGKISKEEFTKMVERGKEDIKYKKYFKQLLAFKDYNYFKSIITKRNIELSQIAKNKINEEKAKNIFILKASSPPNFTPNPYAQDIYKEEKEKNYYTPTEINRENIYENKDKSSPNSIPHPYNKISSQKIKLNIVNIEDEDPITEEEDDEK